MKIAPNRAICATQEEIAEAVGVGVATVNDWVSDFFENSEAEESKKWTGFEPPLYNVWKQQAEGDRGGAGAEEAGLWAGWSFASGEFT